MSDNPALTTGQVAEYCHVCQATILNWIKQGKLEAYKTPGGHYRVPQSNLVSFLRGYGMPVDPALSRSSRPKLLLVSDNARLRRLVRSLGVDEFGVSLASSDFEASAEVVRLQPDIVIIDFGSLSDPMGLCRWISDCRNGTYLVVVGDPDVEATALGAGADAFVRSDAMTLLETKLKALHRHQA
ncbi:MAG: helix-turn-helix domain-containing protein [Anaerolineae bacterium]|jgi:excisionase family DNA binding protein